MQLFDDPSYFLPGKVLWNWLDVDLDRPVYEQEMLVGCEDVLSVKYPTGVLLDVSFFQQMEAEAHFVVEIVPLGDEWKPEVRRVCGTFEALIATVSELTPVARNWKL